MAKDALEERRKRARSSGEKRKEKAGITLKEGPNCLRLGPTPAGKTSPDTYMEYQVHQEVGPKKKYLRCGHPPGWKKGDDDTEDWLCDVKLPELKKKGKASRAEKLAPQTRLVVQASVVNEDDDGNIKFGPFKPWHPSAKTAGSVLTQILGSKSRDYVDRKRGYNINIERTGTGFNDTRYGAIEPDDEPTKVPKELIDAIQPFDVIKGIPKYNAKAQKAAYAGQDFDWKAALNESESEEDSESDSAETESGVDDVFDSESDSSDNKKKRGKNKMAVKKSTKSRKETESDEEVASDSTSESASESASESESESSAKKKKKKATKKKDSDSSSDSASASDSESGSDSESASESASESESEEKPKKKPAKKAAKKKPAKKK